MKTKPSTAKQSEVITKQSIAKQAKQLKTQQHIAKHSKGMPSIAKHSPAEQSKAQS